MKAFLVLSFLISATSMASAPKSSSCQIQQSAEQSTFYEAIEKEIDSGISVGEYSPLLKESFLKMKSVFNTLNQNLCESENGLKSEKLQLIESAQTELLLIHESSGLHKNEQDFISLIYSLFNRAITRL